MKQINYEKFVPAQFYHLDIYKFQTQNGFGRAGHNLQKQLKESFDSCIDDLKFSFDSYFSNTAGFSIGTYGEHQVQLYDKVYSKHGKNFAYYVRNVEHGNKLAAGLELTNRFTVINVCGNSKYSVIKINNILNSSEKPVMIISCSRDLTGVTLTKLHGLIIMGTLTSATNYMQFGLRGKNTYKDREYPCSIFDLNTYSFLKTDAFKEWVMSRAHFVNKTIDQVLHDDYNQYCFEVFELNKYNNFTQTLDFDKTMQKNWSINEKDEISSIYLNEDTLELDDMTNLIPYLHTLKIKENKLIVTEKQCDKPTKTKVPRKNNNNEPAEKLENYQLLLAKLRMLINKIPGFMYLNDCKSLDDLIENKDFHESFTNDFCQVDTAILILDTLRTTWKAMNKSVYWDNLNNAVMTIAKDF